MKSAIAVLLGVCLSACASMTPREHADQVASMPGKKALRVGVVTLGADRSLPEVFPAPAAAPGGAAAPAPVGALYADRTLLPESLPADDVVGTLQQLGAFTDIVTLPFDSRGLASREAVIQRLVDRVWPTAAAQELDAVLVLEGVRDEGLRWSDAEESLFSLDTVLWWLAWPCGLWINDRSYQADNGLVAVLLPVGDAAADPVPVEFVATAGPQRLHPWERASSPLLGLLLPPAWVADDPAAVTAAVREWSRAMLPIDLARRVKEAALPAPGNTQLALVADGDHYRLDVHSDREVTEASVTALPRGALTDASTPEPVPVTLASTIELTGGGPRHSCRGDVARDAVERPSCALVRAQVRLASGEVTSCTWPLVDLRR